jgi:hypothetical protein
LLFRGTIPSLSYVRGLYKFLRQQGIWFKDYAGFVAGLSEEIKEHARTLAEQAKRPFCYLESSSTDKDAWARRIQERDSIREGLVCVLSCVESCSTYRVYKNRDSKRLELGRSRRKCLHLYFYYVDRVFGWMFVRLQTWLPFTMEVYVNGRSYLAQQMDQAGMAYQQADNGFLAIDDLPRAQALLDSLGERPWEPFLDRLAQALNPLLADARELDVGGYYWTLRQSEYASDVMFRDAAALQALYPHWIEHAIRQFSCQDILRFLGRRINGATFSGEIVSDLIRRREGVRLKHRVEENTLKMYDKQHCLLRIEMTINNPGRFKVFRRMTRKGQPAWRWMPMRRGIADIARRVEVCRAANARYLEALAIIGQKTQEPLRKVFDPVSQPIVREGRPYRALRPLTRQETDVFRVVLRGEFQMQGFRNRDLRALLLDKNPDASKQPNKASSRVTRLLRLLRAHSLIAKVPSTRYYRVTGKGIDVMSAALRLREIDRSLLAA